jgi:type III secretory pathway component EscS
MQEVQDISMQNRITNVVATTIAIAGAIVASPSAVAGLPGAIVTVLKTATTLGNTTQPLIVMVAGIVVAALTHPPAWLSGLTQEIKSRL